MKQLPSQDMRALAPHQLIRGEQKAYLMRYSDPVSLNFKLIIDYTKPYGLLADKTYVNSALAYLERIGETERVTMLEVWISNLKSLIKDYEFLFLSVEGLDAIVGMKPGHYPTPDDKITFSIRETIDLKVQSLIANYHHIWYDDTRGVEVLPINLRRFDLSVVVFSSGYYNMMIYDEIATKSDPLTGNPISTARSAIDKKIFPTIRKLSDASWAFDQINDFNHMIYDLTDCTIVKEDSGKSLITEVSNEETSVAKNSLVLNYKFCKFSGSFNNTFGTVNYGNYLALMADLHKFDTASTDGTFLQNLKNRLSERVTAKFNSLTDVDAYTNAGKRIMDGTMDQLRQKLTNLEAAVFSKSSVIGDIWNKISIGYGEQLIQNTINLGISTGVDRFVNDPLTKVNNILFDNFSSNIYDMFRQDNMTQQGTTVIENDVNKPERERLFGDVGPEEQTQQGIRFENRNIYNRQGL